MPHTCSISWSLVKAVPMWDRNSRSSWNSLYVSSTRTPSAVTVCSWVSTARPPQRSTCCCTGLHRRSTALTRDTSSMTPKGLVR